MSLKLKISVLILALVLLTVSLVTVFLLRQQGQSLRAEMTKRGLTIAENLAAGTKSSLLTNDQLSLNVLVKEALKDPDVVYVVIADQDGRINHDAFTATFRKWFADWDANHDGLLTAGELRIGLNKTFAP